MNRDTSRLTMRGIIDPEHLLRAIQNSLEHGDETAHGTTGLHFKHYTIIVHKRKGLFSWNIECKFKRGERETTPSATVPS